jgi:4-hydroxyacetophenone monooxygenase
MIANNFNSIKVKNDTVSAYQESLEARLDKMVWQHPKVSSWYQNSKGKVVTTSPWRLLEYWRWTRNFKPSDYEF